MSLHWGTSRSSGAKDLSGNMICKYLAALRQEQDLWLEFQGHDTSRRHPKPR
jgi:hypothetical protein